MLPFHIALEHWQHPPDACWDRLIIGLPPQKMPHEGTNQTQTCKAVPSEHILGLAPPITHPPTLH